MEEEEEKEKEKEKAIVRSAPDGSDNDHRITPVIYGYI